MSLYSFIRNLINSLLELYSEMDRQTAEFREATGLYCIPGCGQCCESASPEVMVIELLPVAEELFSRGEARPWLERVASVRGAERCVFFQPAPLIPGKGRCLLYLFRPSVCRLFPFAASKNKHGKFELVMCHPLKRERPLSVKAAQEALSEGLAVPSFDSFSIKVAALEPSFGKWRLPINQALRLALERYGLTVQHGFPLLPTASLRKSKDWVEHCS